MSEQRQHFYIKIELPPDMDAKVTAVVLDEARAYLQTDQFRAECAAAARQSIKEHMRRIFNPFETNSSPIVKTLHAALEQEVGRLLQGVPPQEG